MVCADPARFKTVHPSVTGTVGPWSGQLGAGDTVHLRNAKGTVVDSVQYATEGDWAVRELVALQEMQRLGLKNIEKLKGSFSGAFGYAQFLPSSYLTWAKGKKSEPNLFQFDAINGKQHSSFFLRRFRGAWWSHPNLWVILKN